MRSDALWPFPRKNDHWQVFCFQRVEGRGGTRTRAVRIRKPIPPRSPLFGLTPFHWDTVPLIRATRPNSGTYMHPSMHLDLDRRMHHQPPDPSTAFCRCSPFFPRSVSPNGGSNNLRLFNSSGTSENIAGRRSATMPGPSYCAASRCAGHPTTNSYTPGATAISSWKSPPIRDSVYRTVRIA